MANILSLTFNTAENFIEIEHEYAVNEYVHAVAVTKYTTAEQYLADWPEREADVEAMGWA